MMSASERGQGSCFEGGCVNSIGQNSSKCGKGGRGLKNLNILRTSYLETPFGIRLVRLKDPPALHKVAPAAAASAGGGRNFNSMRLEIEERASLSFLISRRSHAK